jgi:hypothetical protein
MRTRCKAPCKTGLAVFITAQLSALLAGRVFAVAFSFLGLHLFASRLEDGFYSDQIFVREKSIKHSNLHTKIE